MRLADLDSRSSLGSDVDRIGRLNWQRDYGRGSLDEVSALSASWIAPRQIRVVVARLGEAVRLSAPALDVVVQQATFNDAWRSFLDLVSKRADSPWLAFEVGPTRRDEIAAGLDVDPDECWAEREAPEAT